MVKSTYTAIRPVLTLKLYFSLVINACTSNMKQVSYDDLVSNSLRLSRIYPFDRTMWYPFVIMIPNVALYWILMATLHLIPGMIFDIILKLKGEKLRYGKLNKVFFIGLLIYPPHPDSSISLLASLSSLWHISWQSSWASYIRPSFIHGQTIFIAVIL